MTSHVYRAYGLVIDSEIEIPELTPWAVEDWSESSDQSVTITIGDVPDHLDNPITHSAIHETTADELLLRIDGVGDYLVSRGSSITIEPVPHSIPHEVRVFLLGSAFGALLHQRGLLVLHASGIGTDHGAAIFAGPSGAGKSTILGELLRRNLRMMVDDVCAIRLDEHQHPIVIPSYPRTRMWADSAKRLGVDTTELSRTRPTMEKFERQVPQQFWTGELRLVRIYQLTNQPGDELSITRLGQIDAFPAILANTYRSILLDGFDMRRHHFQLASAVARAVGVMRVVRPSDSFRVSELADLILDDLEGISTV